MITIFSGYRITQCQYLNILKSDSYKGTLSFQRIKHEDEFIYIGKILLETQSSVFPFEIESIRDYSTNNEVREVRRILTKLFVSEYGNKYPQLFILDQ